MGTIFSSPDDLNPNTTAATTTTANTSGAMSQTPSENATNPDQENTPQPPKTPETLNPNQESSKPVQNNDNPDQELVEEEEEGECPFCGECRETYIIWEKCIEEGENNGEDIDEKCVEVTTALKKCVVDNYYYALILPDQELVEEEEEEEEEEGECRETYMIWKKRIEEGENNGEDIDEKCVEATTALKKCVVDNYYYAPILQAEKSAEQQVRNQLEQEKAKEASETSSDEDEEKVKQESWDFGF